MSIDLDIHSHCEAAIASRFGVAVEVTSLNKYKQKFYKVRKSDETFACLSLRTSPTSSNELWIVKNASGRNGTARGSFDPPL